MSGKKSGENRDLEELRENLTSAAERGDTDAMCRLGGYYMGVYAGFGFRTDFVKAREWYEKAAYLGSAEAMFCLGEFYEDGCYGGVTEDLDRAREWYEKAAELGCERALDKIDGWQRKIEENAEEKAKEKNRSEAAKKLAKIGMTEEDVKDLKRVLVLGKQHFTRLVFKWGYKGCGGANRSGFCLEKYLEIKPEELKDSAVKTIEPPAVCGNVLGYPFAVKAIVDDLVYLVGPRSKDGYRWMHVMEMLEPYTAEAGIAVDTVGSFTITPYQNAFPLRNVPGMIKELMRESKKSGDGNDPQEVKRFLAQLEHEGKRAPEKYLRYKETGRAQLHVLLGEIYESGEYGAERNDKKAVKHYRIAAEEGDCDARARLGAIYHEGRGVKQDYKKAARWYEDALRLRCVTQRGTAQAWLGLGLLYCRGEGVSRNEERARQLWREAAEFDCPRERERAVKLLAELGAKTG